MRYVLLVVVAHSDPNRQSGYAYHTKNYAGGYMVRGTRYAYHTSHRAAGGILLIIGHAMNRRTVLY